MYLNRESWTIFALLPTKNINQSTHVLACIIRIPLAVSKFVAIYFVAILNVKNKTLLFEFQMSV